MKKAPDEPGLQGTEETLEGHSRTAHWRMIFRRVSRSSMFAVPWAAISRLAAQMRIVSVAGIRLDHRKSVRPFKGRFCNNISEFESSHLSHAVGSLWRVYPVHGLCEQRRSL